MPEFQHTDSSQPIHQVVMPLIGVRNGRDEYVAGSAFIIGRGWAVTAYHVVEDFIGRYQDSKRLKQNSELDFQILGYLSLEGGTKFLPLKVLRAWRAEPLDLAVLALGVPKDWPDDYVWKVPAIDLLPPPVGSRIVGFGFASGRVTHNELGKPPTLSVASMSASGEVLEIHHEIRDKARLRFPCFRTDARFDGGMSGGPIINNATGHVCGVICSSMPPGIDDGNYISYGATLWPIVATTVDATERAISGAAPYPLMRLFQNGALEARNLEHVELEDPGDGTLRPRVRYNAMDWDRPRDERHK